MARPGTRITGQWADMPIEERAPLAREMGYDIYSTGRALEAIGHREAFGLNFDPSHLHWQLGDPVKFIDRVADRIYHVFGGE